MKAAARIRELSALAFVAWIGSGLWLYQTLDPPIHLVTLVLGLAWIAVVATASWGAGAVVWRVAGGAADPPLGSWPAVAALGSGLLASVGWLLSLAGALRPTPVLVALALAAVLGVVLRPRSLPGSHLTAPRLAVGSVLGLVALLTVLIALVESPFYDQLHYHLAFPERWLRVGEVHFQPRHVYSHLATQMSLFYTYGLAAFGPVAAQLQHWWCGALVIAGTASLAARLHPGSGGYAALIAATTPSIVIMASWAASDLGLAAFAAGAYLLAIDDSWPVPRDRSRWLLCGLLVGFAVATKYLAVLTVLAPVLLLVLVSTNRRGMGRLLPVVVVGLGATLPLAPWAIANLAATGDPLYPYLSALLRSGSQGSAALAAGVGNIAARPDLLTATTLRTFSPIGEAGLIGPAYLMLLPCAAFWVTRRPSRRTWSLAIAAAAAWVGWTLSPQLGRYLIPALVPLAALIAAGLHDLLTSVNAGIRRLAWLLLAFVLLWTLQGGLTDLGLRRLAVAAGTADPERHLTEYVSYWPAIEAVDRLVPAGDLILLVGEPRCLHFDREVIVEDAFREPLLVELAEAPGGAQGVWQELRHRDVKWLLLNLHEAARIARMTNRSNYFATSDPAAADALARLFSEYLELVWERGDLRLYRMREAEDDS